MSQPLPRFTEQAVQHDPVDRLLAQREAERQRARAKIAAGTWLAPDPADLRGIPCIARGVGGTSPGTNPASVINRLDHRMRAT